MVRRFYIAPDTIDKLRHEGASGPVLIGPDANHIKNVLRLQTGDPVVLFDGAGREYDARIAAIDSAGVRVDVFGERRSETESSLAITIAQGFLKEKKMDELVRGLTELGMTRFTPFLAERSVARPDPKRLRTRAERWEKIALESLKQCRRSRVPDIGATVSFSEMVDLGREADLKVLFWEEEAGTGTSPLIKIREDRYKTVFAALGPEGGFTESEAASAREAGFIVAPLGPRILRAETAAIAACTLLQHLYGDMG
jgi:16S rRNA (uracil1498-N3)-methyltransferase